MADCTMVDYGDPTSNNPYMRINTFGSDIGDGLLISDVSITWQISSDETATQTLGTFDHLSSTTLGGKCEDCDSSNNENCSACWFDDDGNGDCTHWDMYFDHRDVADTSSVDIACVDSYL